MVSTGLVHFGEPSSGVARTAVIVAVVVPSCALRDTEWPAGVDAQPASPAHDTTGAGGGAVDADAVD